MRHPDYKYVNVAVNGVHNRKGIYDITKLGNPTGQTEAYATYFRYNDEMAKHFNQKGTVSGYQGKAWSDWLPIDIDSEDLEEAQLYLQYLVARMHQYGIDANACRFYFSGSKGFHVMIPSAYFQAEPSEDINKRFRKVALTIASSISIDTSIYDKTRIFRLPNTVNQKSGLYKIELYPFEAMSLNIEDILNRARTPVERLEIENDIETSEELSKAFSASLGGNKATGEQMAVKTKICMSTLMNGVKSGNRDNVGVRVASHLMQSGLTPQMMLKALEEWNATNSPPLNDEELSRIYRQGLQGYSFGCHDFILKANCSKDCLFYQESWGRL